MAVKISKTIEDETLPDPLQSVYKQLVEAFDDCLSKLHTQGVVPGGVSDEFIEATVEQLLMNQLTPSSLRERVYQELLRQLMRPGGRVTLS